MKGNNRMDVVSSTAGTVAIAAPITMALVELVKQTGKVRDWVKPILALIFAIGIAFLIAEDLSTRATVFAGLISGLTAAGIYSAGKTVAQATA